MKISFLFLFTIIACQISWCQSADLDRQYFKYSYVRLPLKPILEDNNRTFSVVNLNSAVLTQSFSNNYFISEIRLPGFTKLPHDAFLKIEAKLIDVNIISSTTNSSTTTNTDKEGNKTYTTNYVADVKYKTQGK